MRQDRFAIEWLMDSIVLDAAVTYKSIVITATEEGSTKLQPKSSTKKMKQKMNKALKDSGYEYILSHSNAGAMVHLDESFGAKILKEEKNWGGSKETHYLTETKL